MKNLKLTFAQRFPLTNAFATLTGSTDEIFALWHIFESVRFTEAELKQIKVTDIGNGKSTFEPPNEAFGNIDVQIEDAHAAVLCKGLMAHRGFSTLDAPWLRVVLDQLQGKGN